ncbi:MAG TPA: alanine--glyoxylate aminotransferase family protein [Candidatus Limnocylindria bacterium]|nr:alanine--glyoxylate aminotransferase family protein [Candidatus Limnocylindria bacterium]
MPQNLRIPGPTPIPDDVREAQAAAMIDHRGTEFADMLGEITSGVAQLVATRGEVLLLTGSGTGAMEAAVVNTLSPGDRVLAVSIGSFGDRFARIAEAYGADVERMEVEWGQAAEPQALGERLATGSPFRAVLLTHNETSTGVANPLEELVGAVHDAPSDPLVVVDGISGLGAMPFETDAWGIDLVVSASQKAWMASPGIALAVVGERARAAEQTARMPRYYWDFAEARRWAAKGQTPWTPAVSVLYGLAVGVRRLMAEGRERTWARHAAVAAGAQAGLKALGLELVAPPAHRSATVTAAWLPDGLEWGPFNADMRARGLVVAGGQDRMAGRILRFGHMGMVEPADLAAAVRVMGETMVDRGLAVEPSEAAKATLRAAAQAGEVAAVRGAAGVEGVAAR